MTTPFPFVSAAVLTAAQLNAITTLVTSTKTASHTLTIADVSTRVIMNSASATTITVNNSIFGASDVLEILNIGAGVCTITAGSCSVSTTGTLALVQNAGGRLVFTAASTSIFQADGVAASSGGLTLISATTIGNAVSSVTVSGAFSSTYENYKITVTGGAGSVNDEQFTLKLGSTTTGYYAGYSGTNYAASTATVASDNNAGLWTRFGVGRTNGIIANIDLLGPNLAKNTYIVGSQIIDSLSRTGAGVLLDTTQYTAFTFTPATGTVTGGTIRVYGYANS